MEGPQNIKLRYKEHRQVMATDRRGEILARFINDKRTSSRIRDKYFNSIIKANLNMGWIGIDVSSTTIHK